MTPSQLKNKLESEFQIICFVDLSEINQSHSTIYKIFKDCHREKFENSARLVFYSKHVPSDTLITHIKQAADLIDISDYFIMICGPSDVTIGDMQYLFADVDSAPLLDDQLYISNTLCTVPWMHLAIMNQGEVKPCCVSNDIVGNVLDQKIKDISRLK